MKDSARITLRIPLSNLFVMPQVENEPDFANRLIIDVDWRVGNRVWKVTSEDVSQVAGISHYRYYSADDQTVTASEYILEFTTTQPDMTTYGFHDAAGETRRVLEMRAVVGNHSLTFKGVGNESGWATIVGIEI
ncbi:hypothetical protein BDV98DRAFT_605103 [Pterulicium gracile]|uniref:Uncharacterized protein n=1 Tax=Pterulicium gracile TaxID=1884261 RepID=A0A5C3QFU8_9AGAR|nr:hypothetical protein BDV98DRAFT_605103 [Pterula gracilis]